jgi:hypothetical protein
VRTAEQNQLRDELRVHKLGSPRYAEIQILMLTVKNELFRQETKVKQEHLRIEAAKKWV